MKIHKAIDTNTIGFFNFARGCGVLYVLICHSVFYFYTVTWRSVFNLGAGLMAMFLIISGYGFHTKKMKKCIKIQIKLLIRPYFITACLVLLAKFGLAVIEQRSFWQFGGQYIFSYLLALNQGWKGTIMGLEVDHISMFWFFWALFGGWIIYNAISRLTRGKIQFCLIIGCVFAGWILTLISKVWAYSIPNMLIAPGFLYIGNQMRKHKWLEKANISFGESFILAIPSLITFAFGLCDMYSFTWRLGPLDILGAACLGILFCRFFAWISSFEVENKLTKCFQYIGSNTIGILCIHGFEEKVFPWYRFEYLFPGNTYFAVILCFLLRCIVIFAGLRLIGVVNKTLKKIKKKENHSKMIIK